MNNNNPNPPPADEGNPPPAEDDVKTQLAGDDEGNGEGDGNPPPANDGDEPKTMLAGGDDEDNGEGKEGKGEGEGNGEGEETADDIEKAITEGENEFKGKWDETQVKEMAPLLKECGVSKENASKLAVKLAEIQNRQMQEFALQQRKEQIERIKKQEAENSKNFSKADYRQIMAGMEKYVRKDGPLRALLTTTELGTDPEVLRILHVLGAGNVKETGGDAASGAMSQDSGWAKAFES